jgi:hypothetical protein
MRTILRANSWNFLFFLIAMSFFFGVEMNSFAMDPGTFQGILRSDSNNDESFGFITIVLSSSGTFSMRFNLGVNKIGHHSYSKTGQFTNGVYQFEGPAPTGVDSTRYAIAREIILQLDNASSPQSIEGTVSDFTHSSTVELERVAIFPSDNPAPEQGRYTFLLDSTGQDDLPKGTGFGTVTVSTRGRISATGRTADGKTFHQSAALTVSGRWPVFAKLGGNMGGILSGWLTFQETVQSDFSGTLTWLGPEVGGPGIGPNNAYTPAFTGDLSVAGSRYQIPRGSPVLQTSDSTNNVHLNLANGGLEGAIDRDLTLVPPNKFIFSDRVAGDALSVKANTGLFTGKFMHSDGGVVTFRGAILEKQNRGAGQFVTRDGEIGNAILESQ